MTIKKRQKKNTRRSPTRSPGIELGEVVDLFCGVGALSHGLKRAGFKIVAGYDTNARCKYAFEKNNDATFHARDVANLKAKEIKALFSGKVPSVLAGCAPCQPFSTYKQRYEEDPQWGLVTIFAELAAKVKPDFVTMENVPSLLRYKRGRVFREFCRILKDAGYEVHSAVANCEQFGVPQKRRRLVVIASRDTKLSRLKPTKKSLRTVRDAIGNLPTLAAGETNPSDPLHTSAAMGPLNMRRIKASKPGGTWRDWPVELRATCHRRKSGKTYPGVYARMHWDQPAPTMTTQCFGFGNGRFGHPEQHRAITLREAAILQSFPKSYEFLPRGEVVSFREIGRWIGNAVPVKLAEAIGDAIVRSHNSAVRNGSRP
jgi:DNA (cytosine-5)-methyltransferase 1